MLDDAKKQWKLIESRCPISQSTLWSTQKQIYIDEGINIWRDRPSFVTSSSYVADAIAEIAHAYLLESAPRLNLDEPYYFIEIGAGSGCFAYRFLHGLLRRLKTCAVLSTLQVRYLMTDIVPDIVEFWKRNEMLGPLVTNGILDFAIFDPLTDGKLDIRGDSFDALCFVNPPFVIANSVFDTMAIDAFQFSDGSIEEVYSELYMHEHSSLKEALIANDVVLKESLQSIARPRYENAMIEAILTDYANLTKKGWKTSLPLAAFLIVDALRVLTADKFALLTCSRGFTRPQDAKVEYLDLSFPLNFDALSRYCRSAGARQVVSEHSSTSRRILLSAFGFNSALTSTQLKVDELVAGRRVFSLHKDVLDSLPKDNVIDALIVLAQRTNNDPSLFSTFVSANFDRLEKCLEKEPGGNNDELIATLHAVDEQIFAFGTSIDSSLRFAKDGDALGLLIKVWRRARQSTPWAKAMV